MRRRLLSVRQRSVSACPSLRSGLLLTLLCASQANDALTATICDLAFSSTDTLLLLARTTFLPATRQTHPTCLAYLDRAYRVVSSPLLLSEDRAKLKRFISGTAYHFGGKIYKEGRPVDGLDLLRVGCIVAQEAVSDWKARLVASEDDGAVTEGKDDQWRTLEEDLGKRWELLGTILLKKDNKKVCPVLPGLLRT